MENQRKLRFTSASLHLLAMACMLLDHLWATIVPGNDWMNCVGRIAFPVYAFMAVEGYFHTGNLRAYRKRLLVFALLSEIPFNLAVSGSVFYPFHQNVLWTFSVALCLIDCCEKVRQHPNGVLRIAVGVGAVLLACGVSLFTMMDYYHAGILTVLVFYIFRGRNWKSFLGQALCLWYINTQLLGGVGYPLFGGSFFFPRQGFALLALIPIWLYRGKKGYQSKGWQYFCYAFYPGHLLVLGILGLIL